LPEAAAWQVEHRGVLTVAVAGDGTPDEVRADAALHELANSIVDSESRLYEQFGANGTPSGVLIAPDGTVASGLATGADRIRSLVARVLAGEPSEPGLPVGSELPPLELASLDGATVNLAELKGRPTLLVFWNPSCGHCRAMHEDLVAWERSVNGDGPRLVVVSSGDAASTRDEDFHSLVLLDSEFAAAEVLGGTGTPSGLLVDAAGHVASGIAVGAHATLGLARNVA
jgi:thiol-disulfide isomerase/thioredoxin